MGRYEIAIYENMLAEKAIKNFVVEVENEDMANYIGSAFVEKIRKYDEEHKGVCFEAKRIK